MRAVRGAGALLGVVLLVAAAVALGAVAALQAWEGFGTTTGRSVVLALIAWWLFAEAGTARRVLLGPATVHGVDAAALSDLHGLLADLGRDLRVEVPTQRLVVLENNAAILTGLTPRLFVGLPLLILLDSQGLRAILAHELVHLSQTSGGLSVLLRGWLARLASAALPQARGSLLLRLIGLWLRISFVPLVDAEELDADTRAASLVGAERLAAALLLSHSIDLPWLAFRQTELRTLAPGSSIATALRRFVSTAEAERLAKLSLDEALSARPRLGVAPLRRRLLGLGFRDGDGSLGVLRGRLRLPQGVAACDTAPLDAVLLGRS